MPDRPGGNPGDEELPPDPWASVPPSASDGPSPDGAPDGIFGGGSHDPFATAPTRPRTPWQHPAVWIGVVVLALILLVGALLESRSAPQREPSPDAVTTAGTDPRS